ncbi:carnitine O-acetyltransferase-like [Diadema setosum]|uniref:carnitine O-acetyltransferase-like n=1 Tax=Diadema setosum TaxID=31175 RepID=UPI003B3AF1F1
MFTRVPRHVLRQVMGITSKDGAPVPGRLARGNVHAGRMFAHQDSLARLPVPPLQQTLYKYLMTCKPLLSPEDYETTKKIVDDFGRPGGIGQELQMGLINRSKKFENWLSDWWLRVAYLEFRSPVVVNVSPGVIFPRSESSVVGSQEGQLQQAAKLITGIMDFKYMIDTQSVPVDKMGGQPLCMDQYYKILASCRVPGPKIDGVVTYPPNMADAPKHIVVMYNNQLYTLDVLRADGKPHSLSDLYAGLKHIVDATPIPAVPVGILTSEHRNTWGKIYKKMKKDRINKASFEKIKRSLFLVSLDQDDKPGVDVNALSCRGRQSLYGGGSHISSGNRWFDKTLQFWVGRSGYMGMTYEHCTAEGPPIVALVDHSLKYMNNIVEGIGESTPGVTRPERLEFNIDPEILDTIDEAKQNIDIAHDELQVTCFQFSSFGKDFPKSQRLSPDAFFQIAIQYTFFKLYGHSTATYESGSLRKYKYGRTDTIRSASIDSDNFARAMLDPAKKPSERVMLFRKAIEAHKQYTNDVINGDGIDRHLLGLKLTAIEKGLNVPDLFMDTAFTSSFHFRLSTSQVPGKEDLLMLFGPVVPDGYGICYNPHPNHFNISITAYNTSPETDSDRFAATLTDNLLELQELLLKAPPAARL